MNASNGCHSARTIGQFSIGHGFAVASHQWFHPPILHITAGLATLKRCDAKGSDFNQKGEADIGRHRLRRSSASDRVDQSGIIGVRTCREFIFGWLASIHRSIGTLTRCIDTWLCNGFSSMVSACFGDLQRFLLDLYLHECLQRLSLGQNNWPIACNKWFHHDCRWWDDLEL